jgi:tetratricopeptide (TPR) repeat protein
MTDWNALAERGRGRYDDGLARLPDDPDRRQRQLTRTGNAAYGAGLALLMLGRTEEAAEWLRRSAERWRESFADAPPDSWGRPIGAIKALLLAGNPDRAADAARWALDAGAADARSPIGRYAATLALLVLGEDEPARALGSSLRERDDFPRDVAAALATIAAGDRVGYTDAVESVLESFETRTEYLEDVPVADTVLVLQSLARERGLAAELASPLLPAHSPSV